MNNDFQSMIGMANISKLNDLFKSNFVTKDRSTKLFRQFFMYNTKPNIHLKCLLNDFVEFVQILSTHDKLLWIQYYDIVPLNLQCLYCTICNRMRVIIPLKMLNAYINRNARKLLKNLAILNSSIKLHFLQQYKMKSQLRRCLLIVAILLVLSRFSEAQIDCQGGLFYDSLSGSGQCVTSCTNSQLVDVQKKNCIAGPTCPTNQIAVNRFCLCQTGFFLDFNGTACVSSCNSRAGVRIQALDISGSRCIIVNDDGNAAAAVCPGINQIYSAAQNQCICDYQNGFFLKVDKSSCTSTTGECLVSLNQQYCVENCPQVGAILGTDGFGNEACVCEPGSFSNIDGTQCSLQCEGGVLSLNRQFCLLGCPADQTLNQDKGGCECVSGTVQNLKRNRCVEECQANQDLSLRKQRCLLSTQNCIDSVGAIAGSNICACTNAARFVTYQDDQCVAVCPAGQTGVVIDGVNICNCNIGGTGFYSIDSNQCLTACPAGQFVNLQRTRCVPACDRINQVQGIVDSLDSCICDLDSFLDSQGESCINQCPENQLINVEGTQCILIEDCTQVAGQITSQSGQCVCAQGYFLNRQGDGCVNSCLGNQALNLPGTQCVHDTCDTNQEVINNRCVCQDTFLPSASNSVCVTTCGPNQFLNIQKTACVASCDGLYQSEENNQCFCFDSYLLLNGQSYSCVLNCPNSKPFINLNGQCVSDCPVDTERYGDNFCRCQQNFFIYDDGITKTCVSSQECDDIVDPHVISEDFTRCIPTAECITYTSGVQCDACTGSQIVSLDGTDCVAYDGTTCPVVSLSGLTCVSSCPQANQIQVQEAGQKRCACAPGFFETEIGLYCTDQCPTGQVISLDKTYCIQAADCLLVGQIDASTGSCKCISPLLVDIGGLNCISAAACQAQAGKSVSLDGTKCVADCTVFEGMQDNSGLCRCLPDYVAFANKQGCLDISPAIVLSPTQVEIGEACATRGQFYSKTLALGAVSTPYECVSTCSTAIDIQFNICYLDSSCHSFNQEVAPNGRCTCKSTKPYYYSTNRDCEPDCNNLDLPSISLDGTICVVCDSLTMFENAADQCQCNPGLFIDFLGTGCVSSCNSTLQEVLDLTGKRCLRQCPDGAEKVDIGNNQQQCVCSNSFLLNSDADGCIAECPVTQYLNVAGEQCVIDCPTGQIEVIGSDPKVCKCDNTGTTKYFLLISVATPNTCVAQCPAGQAVDVQLSACVPNTCSTLGQILGTINNNGVMIAACKCNTAQGYSLLNGVCISPQNPCVFTDQGQQCAQCAMGICTQCKTGFAQIFTPQSTDLTQVDCTPCDVDSNCARCRFNSRQYCTQCAAGRTFQTRRIGRGRPFLICCPGAIGCSA